jgi:hypothetical protein
MKIPALRSFVEMYSLMIKEGRIKEGGSGHQRLLTLKTQLRSKTDIKRPFVFKNLKNWIFNHRPDDYEKKSKN